MRCKLQKNEVTMLSDNTFNWHCLDRALNLNKPRIMGIVNVTPDSFSDGGQFSTPQEAIAYGLGLLDAGADILDVGGESTRLGADPVDEQTEANRIVPVIRELLSAGAVVSVDTHHASVAELCLKLGAHIINDVDGFTDERMVSVVKESDCGCVIVHSKNVSKNPHRKSVLLDTIPRHAAPEKPTELEAEEAQETQVEQALPTRRFPLPESAPIMRRIMGFLGDQARTLLRAGVSHDRIALDPGAGFGKFSDEDVIVQRATAQLASMGYPLLCATSRKRFLGTVAGVIEPEERDSATIGSVLAAAEAGARILRVHNVREVAEALRAYWTIAHPYKYRAFVALGSNLGNPVRNLAKACAMINDLPLTCIAQTSHAYRSDPAYGLSTDVANAVLEVHTELSPEVLLDHLLAIEKAMGRKRPTDTNKKAPRTIDCDLVFVEGETHDGVHLKLPHPGMVERDFVLIPMEDLLPDPARYLKAAGLQVKERSERYGIVREDLGLIPWEELA